MKKGKFLQLHELLLITGVNWIGITGNLYECGLCELDIYKDNQLSDDPIFQMFDLPAHAHIDTPGKYTPLRQNIILFCAAINGEL